MDSSVKPLTVIIGTYNRLSLLKQCLDSLHGCNSLDKVIVADAGSKDGTIEYLRDKPGISLVCDDRRIGQAKSFNLLLPMIRSKYAGWISDDNIVRKNALDDAVEILDLNADIGMVGLKVRDKTGKYAGHPYLGAVWPSGVLTINQGVLRTGLLREIGGFDETFNDYGMDVDLTTRILLKGYKVVLTRSVAIHHYRDHQTSNWTDEEGRRKRIQSAKALYKERYSSLIEERKKPVLPISARILESLKWKFGGFGRDLRNILLAEYISHMDLFRTSNKKYYLVQSIPGHIIRKMNDTSGGNRAMRG